MFAGSALEASPAIMTMSPNPNPVEAPAVLGDAATPDPVESARAAGLRYVQDDRPGIRREKISENNFRYFHPDGSEVTDEDTLARIRSLGIPPAYTDVWICPIAKRPFAGDGPRCAGPQAVPLPPPVSGNPRRDQVRPHGRLW
jgi:hypothetical protein